MIKRLQPNDRKQEILQAALIVAARPGGWANLTRLAVAHAAQCSEGLPSKYFGTMLNFKRAIMRAAVAGEHLAVIAQGIAAGDKSALKASKELQQKALATLQG